MNAIREFLKRVTRTGVRRPQVVKTVTMGRSRAFRAWDVGEDTFIFEEGIEKQLEERPSVLVVDKRELRRGARGRVLTMSTGNHAVAAFPLLDGRFWKLSRLHADRRGDVLMKAILCANVVNARIETSQRDVPSRRLYAYDEWLLGTAGFSMADIVMGDRNEMTLERYRQMGQEWRIKPLAWTEREMKTALAGSRKRIATRLRYYHSARGVHFLTYPEVQRLVALANDDFDAFVAAMHELVSLHEGDRYTFTRMPKFRGHHEIEFFGLRRGMAVERLVPVLENLMGGISLGRVTSDEVRVRLASFLSLYASLLTKPTFADEASKEFIETLYMHITGEIYAVMGEGSTPAFDDRRTALPGATYRDGRARMHPGADERSEVLLSNLRGLMSKDEVVVYANVYEIREEEDVPIGLGKTREVVFRTNRNPLEQSLIEKRLSHSRQGYGSYMLARIDALRALGVHLSENYRLLRRRAACGRRGYDFYIRARCAGEPLEAIPKTYFCSTDDSSVEQPDAVRALAVRIGDAAAQNMAMKKYDAARRSPLFGVGKEIYDFEFYPLIQRVMPKEVSICSVRGAFGWPNLAMDEENLSDLAAFYLSSYAHVLRAYQRQHAVPMAEVAESFLQGFEYRTHAMAWQLSVMRDQFESFDPALPSGYAFARKWRFVMWSLERQERRLSHLRRLFMEQLNRLEQLEVEEVQHEDVRDNPQ